MAVSREYRLHGPQVEPTSSFWLDSPLIRVPNLSEVQKHADSGNARLHLDPKLFFSDGDPDVEARLEAEFKFLKAIERVRMEELQSPPRRDDVYTLVPFDQGTPPGDFRGLTPLSRFLDLRDPPFGTSLTPRSGASS
jgi:hypothetical protein